MDVNATLGTTPLSGRVRSWFAAPDRLGRPVPSISPMAALVRAHRQVHPGADTTVVRKAYVTAKRAHEGQFRKSGEPYVTHPVAVAQILADLGMDTTTLVAALLHDTVEDTPYTLELLREDFGDEVAHLVDGVTKFDKGHFGAIAEAETIRKMMVAARRDVRVLVIKLADRLHNMRTLDARSPASRARIAGATREVLVPLCDRLGIQVLKRELEDVVLEYLEPDTFAEIDKVVQERPLWKDFLDHMILTTEHALRADEVRADVQPRHRHHYTIWRDTRAVGHNVKPLDMPRIVVLVDGPDTECYTALGAIHRTFRPVPGRFKDYIASPKNNLYRSLHTTVLGPDSRPVEVLIRTQQMHRDVEYGIIARFRFPPNRVLSDKVSASIGQALTSAPVVALGKRLPDALRRPLAGALGKLTGDAQDARAAAAEAAETADLEWLRRVLDLEQDTSNAAHFVRSLRSDLAETQIQVIARGRTVVLPSDSTPVDVAYEFGPAVGDRILSVAVNGEMAALSTALVDGDVVEIIEAAPGQPCGPFEDWLSFAKSPKARVHLRRRFRSYSADDVPSGTITDRIAIGRAALGLALRRRSRGLADDEWLVKLAEQLDYPDLDTMLVTIAEHRMSADSAVDKLIQLVDHGPTG
ncbi:MAG: bifunctional (p)ppGpp synthetase/guanosine-3',5'-bis(diphosphate) 3'-pyrophosphohydrolase [Hamadaea sp.]|uniref:RelA/SpoT family protein n=1 Tax=Hamadaea sp. TaxID=2024425 RepID=UPI0017D67D66|nr:HD domain-containing protein [Hamadaea sp.]NUR72626.1 bifunctional (p)ppGpp synthetase/guanosine-3',5'-bis(diphosphate) 3'-pyrophosphohydrolase [Hamadaea sp.]NUT23079.1 bifunctional (p)ppGpp synthetase/guanosine-3',5'-bis(diphosphate) 3'-pyrophosphohydrolase [Hamadaea sp.]